MAPLRRKVLRDLRRLWAQVLAIALVLAAGVATLTLGTGAYASLFETRARYYEQNRFADVFAEVTRAPRALLDDIAALDGVLEAEGRIVKPGQLDIPGMVQPGSVLFVSLPGGTGQPGLNRLHLRQGRLPEPQAASEAVLSEAFATAHRLSPGDRLDVLMHGQRRALTITGVALSPEFIYAIGPGEMMPDPRRFGIVWMPQAGLEAAFDLEGAFSNLVLKLAPGAGADRVIAALERLTARYGGLGAIGRADQTSHAFIDAELRQLRAMVLVLPPVFLLVAAMLVNMTLSRLVVLEREQIGLLKAMGYSSGAVARHYAEFVLVIGLAGIVLGLGAGAWLGTGLTRLYARFFAFPFLVFARDPQIYWLAAGVALGTTLAGALRAVRRVAALPPAIAMAPPAPETYRASARLWGRLAALRRREVMVLRHLLHWPLRTVSSVLGIAMAVAVLVASLWSWGSIERMIDITFHRAQRQDASLVFGAAVPSGAVRSAAQMPGVLTAEPYRAVSATIASRNRSKRIVLMGHPARTDLARILDLRLQPITMPQSGVILSHALAEALEVRPGDLVTLDIREGAQPRAAVRVSGLSTGYVGLGAAMEIGALNRLMREGSVVSGAHLQLDPARAGAFFAAARDAPGTERVSLTAATLQRFRDTLAENITIMVTVYVTLATIIAVGVVYNFARILMSEQGRELASLRVLGFTRAEVAALPLGELAVVVLLAQPAGWLIGHGIARAMVAAFSSDLYRVPFVIGPQVYATASLIVCAAALASALAIRVRVDRLDMIEVLKTRE